MRTLVLNATYEPLNVTNWKRAINLVLQGKAVVEHDSSSSVHSAKGSMPKPSVIRLTYMAPRHKIRRRVINRGAILARDRHVCQFTHCSRRGDTIDHVIPRSKGGKHEWGNVVAACKHCNFKKADKTMEQMGWKLKRQPKAPAEGRFMVIGHNIEPEWEQYLNP